MRGLSFGIVGGLLLLSLASVGAAGPVTYYVKMPSAGGSDVTGDGSWEAPYATISNAVAVAITNTAVSEATISVQPGTYPGGTRMEYRSGTSWTTSSKPIKIRAQKRVGDDDVDNPNPRETVIDCACQAAGAWLCGSSTLICGLTITNGVWQRDYQMKYSNFSLCGAGLYLSSGATASNLVICCCIVTPDDRVTTTCAGAQYAVVTLNGGTITDSLIYNCTNHSTAASRSGEINAAGLCMSGKSLARRCIVSNCCTIAEKSGGNHRGGGVYMGENSKSTLDSCQILDCVGRGVSGGGICLLKGVTVTNCLVSGCWSNSGGGGICGEYGCGLIVDTTITNCWITGGNGCGLNMSPYAAGDQVVRRCRIVDCNKGNTPVYQTYGLMEDCVIENNAYAWGVVHVSGKESILRACVIRNNRATSGSVIQYVDTGPGTSTVERCWIVGNTCASWYGVLHNTKGYHLDFVIDGCIVTGNSAGYGVCSMDATSFSATSGEIKYLPETARHPFTQVRNCSIVNNTLSSSGIYFSHNDDTLGGPQYLSVTNCLVAGNTNSSGAVRSAFAFDSTVKSHLAAHPEQIAYSAMPAGTAGDLPEDPEGVAHNQIGKIRFRPGTVSLTNSSVTRNNACPLPKLTADGATDLGDGTFTVVKSADWGVHIVPNAVNPRVLDGAPDIGARESRRVGLAEVIR